MNKGIFLDIGGGDNPRPGFVNMDYRPGDKVDVVHNCLKFPWPFEDESVATAMASHLVEHISPDVSDPRVENLVNLLITKGVISKDEVYEAIGEHQSVPLFMRFMDEVWRVLKVGGEFGMEYPYGGSIGYWQDPTHVNGISQNTWRYFDPEDVSGLYNIYRPKPWKIKHNAYQINGFAQVVLVKRGKDAK